MQLSIAFLQRLQQTDLEVFSVLKLSGEGVERGGSTLSFTPPTSSCLQTRIFEWKSFLNFNPCAKFQNFDIWPPVLLGQFQHWVYYSDYLSCSAYTVCTSVALSAELWWLLYVPVEECLVRWLAVMTLHPAPPPRPRPFGFVSSAHCVTCCSVGGVDDCLVTTVWRRPGWSPHTVSTTIYVSRATMTPPVVLLPRQLHPPTLLAPGMYWLLRHPFYAFLNSVT